MTRRCQIMGIVNVTPDSFSDGGRFFSVGAAIEHAIALAAAGADILDIGGESTRPGAETVSVTDERARVLPVIKGLRGRTSARLSIDTRKPEIAQDAVAEGATIWNDVSALLYDPASMATAASLNCDIVLMHAKGEPRTMQDNPSYRDVVADVSGFLTARIAACIEAGIDKKRLIIDPGIGFGKSLDHNIQLIRALDEIVRIGPPVLFGASRKRFIAALDRDDPAGERIGGSIAAALTAWRAGAAILRVHDVAATRQAMAVASAIEP